MSMSSHLALLFLVVAVFETTPAASADERAQDVPVREARESVNWQDALSSMERWSVADSDERE